MAREPVVSVLMTTYNRADYVAAAIESVLAQHFGDFELLVTDNRSTDDTVEIARSYERRDPRVRVVVNEENLGQFGNRNRAAQLARGVLMRYADSDDLLYPHCLSTTVPPLLREPRAAFALSRSKDFPGGPCPMLLTPRMSYQREFLSFDSMFHGGPSHGLFRTKAFHALGGWVDHGSPSDYLFWLRACARVHVLALPGDLFWYRRHGAQELMNPKVRMQEAVVWGEMLRAIDAPECPLTPEEREHARRHVVRAVAKLTAADARAGQWDVLRARLRHMGLDAASWRRYLARPARAVDAGTPRTPEGEFVMPDWDVYAPIGETELAELLERERSLEPPVLPVAAGTEARA